VRLIAQRFRVERILGQSWHPRSTIVRVLWLNARQQLKTTLGRLGLLEGFRRVLRHNIPVPSSTGKCRLRTRCVPRGRAHGRTTAILR
jgi:hypothetical protein